MENMETLQYKNYTIIVSQDIDAENPRQCHNFSKIYCSHPLYRLGDDIRLNNRNCENWHDELKLLKSTYDIAIVKPLYLLNLGFMKFTITAQPPEDAASNSLIGFVFVTNEYIQINYSSKDVTNKILEKAEALLDAEVNKYAAYLRGDFYSYEIINNNGETIHTCGGFWGAAGISNSLLDARKYLDNLTNQLDLFAA